MYIQGHLQTVGESSPSHPPHSRLTLPMSTYFPFSSFGNGKGILTAAFPYQMRPTNVTQVCSAGATSASCERRRMIPCPPCPWIIDLVCARPHLVCRCIIWILVSCAKSWTSRINLSRVLSLVSDFLYIRINCLRFHVFHLAFFPVSTFITLYEATFLNSYFQTQTQAFRATAAGNHAH